MEILFKRIFPYHTCLPILFSFPPFRFAFYGSLFFPMLLPSLYPSLSPCPSLFLYHPVFPFPSILSLCFFTFPSPPSSRHSLPLSLHLSFPFGLLPLFVFLSPISPSVPSLSFFLSLFGLLYMFLPLPIPSISLFPSSISLSPSVTLFSSLPVSNPFGLLRLFLLLSISPFLSADIYFHLSLCFSLSFGIFPQVFSSPNLSLFLCPSSSFLLSCLSPPTEAGPHYTNAPLTRGSPDSRYSNALPRPAACFRP